MQQENCVNERQYLDIIVRVIQTEIVVELICFNTMLMYIHPLY